jgi:hypothetical protein
MSTKHVRTAADLVRFGCALNVECLARHHTLTMEGYEFARGGWNVAAEAIGGSPALLPLREERGEDIYAVAAAEALREL